VMLRSPHPLYCWPGSPLHIGPCIVILCFTPTATLVISVANAAMLLYVGLVYRLEINGLDGDCTYRINSISLSANC